MDKNLNIEENIIYSYIGVGNDFSDIEKKAKDINVWFRTFKAAKEAAEQGNPDYKPYLIIKKTEHFEIVG